MNSSEHMIYLRTYVKPVLSELMEEIITKKPEDIVTFSINWLKQNKEKNPGN